MAPIKSRTNQDFNTTGVVFGWTQGGEAPILYLMLKLEQRNPYYKLNESDFFFPKKDSYKNLTTLDNFDLFIMIRCNT